MTTFGIEIECASPVSHRDVADALGRAGVRAVTAAYSGRDYTLWQVKSDVTIPTRPGHAYQVEVVSPVLTWDNPGDLAQLEAVCQVLTALDCKVYQPRGDRSAGLHVHLQMDDLGPARLAAWFRAWGANQPTTDLLVRSGRHSGGPNAHWCRTWSGAMIDRAATAAESGDARRLTDVAASHGWAVNTQWFAQRGTLEVRQRDGSTNYRKIIGWVAYLMATKAHAESGHAFNGSQDYLAWLVSMGFLSAEHREWAERRNCGGGASAATIHATATTSTAQARLARLRSLQGIS